MKTKSTFIIVFTTLLICTLTFRTKAQTTPEFEFFLAFEDSAGNKDTIYVGYDSQATSGLDSVFGEYNIKTTPFDSVFEVRVSNYFNSVANEYALINNDYSNFHTKKQILSNTCNNQWLIDPKVIPILVHSKNYPIKVKWNNSNSFNFADTCLYNSLFNYVNPTHWYDVGTSYSPVSPFFFNQYLRFNDSITFDSILVWVDPLLSYDTEYINMPPEHYIDANNDTIRVIYFGFFKDLLALSINYEHPNITIYPNPAKDYIKIEGLGAIQVQIEIYDVLGRLLLKQEVLQEKNSICIKELPKGIMFIRFDTDKGVIVKKFFKN
ncbi:MAG: hypothetical protein BWY70_01059 [Bacteroidetes bacterium ADurb.Bin408]|nr:MAG: hypothetical protein BWY70_01059 [Bacteroidetes bacterium ADurb.Bin408]